MIFMHFSVCMASLDRIVIWVWSFQLIYVSFPFFDGAFGFFSCLKPGNYVLWCLLWNLRCGVCGFQLNFVFPSWVVCKRSPQIRILFFLVPSFLINREFPENFIELCRIFIYRDWCCFVLYFADAWICAFLNALVFSLLRIWFCDCLLVLFLLSGFLSFLYFADSWAFLDPSKSHCYHN